MSKTKKIILLGVLAVVLVAVGIGVYVFEPFLAMRPIKTGLVLDRNYNDLPIIAVRNGMGAAFFIQAESGTILIDAGSNAGKLEASMEAEGIQPEDVKWILLTHSDYDHVAALGSFPGAEIYMSEDELGHIDGRVPRKGVGVNDLPEAILLKDIQLLYEGQELLLGGATVTCVKAPGHTAGSMVYLIGRNLFSGDAVRIKGKGLTVSPFNHDNAQAEASVQKLQNLPWNMIFSAHYGSKEK